MQATRLLTVIAMLIYGNVMPAQVKLPELKFPSANGSRAEPVKVKRIHGIVVDINGAVIPKVQVELQRDEGGKFVDVGSVFTDSLGRFDFSAPGGKYQLTFRGRAFREEVVHVETSEKGWPGFKLTLTLWARGDTLVMEGAALH